MEKDRITQAVTAIIPLVPADQANSVSPDEIAVAVEKIKEYLHQHNKQYWNCSKKRYQVLYLMKLNNELEHNN